MNNYTTYYKRGRDTKCEKLVTENRRRETKCKAQLEKLSHADIRKKNGEKET